MKTSVPLFRLLRLQTFRFARIMCLILVAGLGTSDMVAAEPDKDGFILLDGLRVNMPAGEAAAYLKSKGIRADEAIKDGVAVVIIKKRERIAGMTGEMSLGFSRRGLQTLTYDFDGIGLPDHGTVVKRLTGYFGKPVGEYSPRLLRGLIGNSAFAHTFFGGPPTSVSLFYRVFCAPYPRRQPGERMISIHVDLRPIIFPPKQVMITGDADGWCDAA
jgi:hypothetical protein